MVKAAEVRDPDIPLLVHTDARLVDQVGDELGVSLWDHHRSLAKHDRLSDLLVRNTVTGCTTMVNRALLEFALPVPDEAIMHDWWLALVASATGDVVRMPIPLVDYRQHSANAAGAQGLSLRRIWHLASGRGREKPSEHLRRTYSQAATLLERIESNLEPSSLKPGTRETVSDWAKMRRLSPIARRLAFIKGDHRVPGLAGTLGVAVNL